MTGTRAEPGSVDLTKLDPALRVLVTDPSAPCSATVDVIVGLAANTSAPENFGTIALNRLGPLARSAEVSLLQLRELSLQKWVKYLKPVDLLRPVTDG